jgi:hypothetical protein
MTMPTGYRYSQSRSVRQMHSLQKGGPSMGSSQGERRKLFKSSVRRTTLWNFLKEEVAAVAVAEGPMSYYGSVIRPGRTMAPSLG